MPDSLDAIEMREVRVDPAPDTPIEDIMFPDLPPDVRDLNDAAKQVHERNVRTRMRSTVMLVMRQQGYTRREIGKFLNITPNAVRVALNRARAAGKLNDLRAILENDSLALAVESLNFHLKKKDKDLTLETLKGLGQFKSYNNTKNEGAPGFTMPSLTVTVVNAPNHAGEQVIVSAPVGTPREDKKAEP